MSPRKNSGRRAPSALPVFAALGDRTRMALVTRLGDSPPLSITRLTKGSGITRQAVTKHLRVLQRAGLVRSIRHGRELRFTLEPQAIEEARRTLELISRQWDDALSRLKALVERRPC